MHDLTAFLLPDGRAPLSGAEETALIGALARMHARFWNADALQANWLVRPAQYCDESMWNRLGQVAIVCGARMLLWSKALAADSGRAGAEDEWNWWLHRLELEAEFNPEKTPT